MFAARATAGAERGARGLCPLIFVGLDAIFCESGSFARTDDAVDPSAAVPGNLSPREKKI